MVINELIIKNFGKFKDKSIEFQDGVNIIYGKNESGKSTIHSFIKGMLYGIEKSRQRKTIDTYEKYLPWEDQGIYEGVMKLTVDDKTYRIRRSFINKKAFCELREEQTGSNIVLNGKEPGEVLLGISESSFKDTVFIGQLLARTSEALAVDIKSYIANISTTKNTEIDLSKVYEQIEKESKKNNIKFDDKQLQDIENELKEIVSKEQLRDSLSELLEEKISKQKDIERTINQIETQVTAVLQNELWNKYNKCKQIQNEISKSIEQIQPLLSYSKIREEDLDIIAKESSDKKGVLEEIKVTHKKIEELEQQVQESEEKLLIRSESNKEYIENNNRLEQCMKKELEAQNNIDKIIDKKSKESATRKIYTKWIATIVSVIIIIKWLYQIKYGTTSMDAVTFSIGILGVGLGIIFIFNKLSKHESIKNKEDLMDSEDKLKQALYAKPVLISLNNLELQLKSEKLNVNRKKLLLENIEVRLQSIYMKQKISSEIDISLYRNKLNEYRRLANSIDKNENILGALLAGNNMEELKLQAEKVVKNDGIQIEVDKEELLTKSKILNKQRDALIRETSTYLGKLEELEAIDSKRLDAEEKKETLLLNKEKIVIEQQAIKMAKDKIQQISEQIQKGFGKELDAKVSNVVKTITDGKYNNINIDTDSKMTMDDGYNNIEIERLSLGTIDQMFLALRVGVDELLYQKANLPIILDDSFSLYDDERMFNVLKWFLSQEKQILLFSCQVREMDKIKNIEKTSNIILL